MPGSWHWDLTKHQLTRTPIVKQFVRFNPSEHNRGAGNLWAGFCNDHNAASTKNGDTGTYIVSSNLKSDKPKISTEDLKNKDKTIHSTVKVKTKRAIFGTSEFEGLKDNNDDGLAENPCYPKHLVDDPGWALLTDDPWYEKHPQSKANVDNYRKAPGKKVVEDAMEKVDAARKNGEKFDTVEAFNDVAAMNLKVYGQGKKPVKKFWDLWVGNEDGHIPEELWGVLPSLLGGMRESPRLPRLWLWRDREADDGMPLPTDM